MMNNTGSTFLLKLYTGILLIVFGLIVLHAPLSVGFGTLLPDYSLLIKSWKEVLLLVALPLALILITRQRLWGQLKHDKLIWLLGGYSFLHIIMLICLPHETLAVLAGLAIDLRYILFFGLVYVLLKLAPDYRRKLLAVAGIGAFIVVGFGMLQLFLPADILSHIGYNSSTIAPYLTVDKNPDFVRINSTLRGPNPLGAYVVIVLVCLSALYVRRRLNIRDRRVVIASSLVVLCSLVTLWLSYSRSALVATLVAVAIVVMVRLAHHLSTKAWVIAGATLVVFAGGLFLARTNTVFSNIVLHENPNGGSSVNSNEGHIESLRDGSIRLARQPFGAGIGSAGSASLYTEAPLVIENQYLFIAHEVGWLGLALFITIYVVLLRHLWRGRGDWLALGVFASGIGLAIIGLLLPVWVDDTVSIIWWGLAAIATAGPRVVERKHHERRQQAN